MGLWLKCPKCQAANPLDFKSCQECNASLENLPAADRVYILSNEAPAAPKAAAGKAAAPKAAPAKKAAAKKPAAKAKPKAAPEEMDMEVIASTAPPAKRAKGPKGRKKKKQE